MSTPTTQAPAAGAGRAAPFLTVSAARELGVLLCLSVIVVKSMI